MTGPSWTYMQLLSTEQTLRTHTFYSKNTQYYIYIYSSAQYRESCTMQSYQRHCGYCWFFAIHEIAKMTIIKLQSGHKLHFLTAERVFVKLERD